MYELEYKNTLPEIIATTETKNVDIQSKTNRRGTLTGPNLSAPHSRATSCNVNIFRLYINDTPATKKRSSAKLKETE